MKTRIITVANQKGGVAKTTTSSAIAATLSKKHGRKVLCIDMDPQANLTDNSGAEQNQALDNVLRGQAKISDHIQETENYDILGACISLAAMELELNGMLGREQRLREAIESDPKLGSYDFIIIDTAPSLGTLTVAALVASTDVIIPTMADINSTTGIQQLGNTIDSVRKYFNRDLKTIGVVFTRFNPRTNISKQIKEVAQMLAAQLGTKIFDTFIRQSVVAAEANYCKKSLLDYNSGSTVSDDYAALVEEILKEVE